MLRKLFSDCNSSTRFTTAYLKVLMLRTLPNAKSGVLLFKSALMSLVRARLCKNLKEANSLVTHHLCWILEDGIHDIQYQYQQPTADQFNLHPLISQLSRSSSRQKTIIKKDERHLGYCDNKNWKWQWRSSKHFEIWRNRRIRLGPMKAVIWWQFKHLNNYIALMEFQCLHGPPTN